MPTGGAIKHYVVTMTAGPDNLATVLGLTKGGDVNAEPTFSELHFEAFAANAAITYVGTAGSGVTSTNYGFSLPVGATRFSYMLGGSYESGRLKLSSLEVKGSAGEKIAIIGVMR